MKILLLFATVALLVANAAHAQKLLVAQVPAATKTTLAARFPGAQRATWKKEGADFEANFTLDGKSMSAVVTPAGALQETEADMPPAQLPAAVRATLARDYKAYRVSGAATIVQANGTTVYEAEVAKGGKKQDVLFTANGQLVAN